MPKVLPEARHCKRGCCWTPMQVCAVRYHCRCHASKDSTAAARARLVDYIDSLGDDE